ncbi:MAG TPA: undecaprenyl-diphosphate phosphatase [Phototrophicaceae bacterium]|nr:undecaprenyl-diphosphate phosphatase [Phototrophicaceae bacterium]
MLDWIKVIILGIVQGITEFLPISSTGHLIVAAALLDFGQRMQGTFEIFIQIGSVVAALVFYRAEIWGQVKGVTKDSGVQWFWLGIIIAFIPAGLVAFFFRDWIKTLYSPVVVAVSLIIGGIVFLVIERQKLEPRTTEVTAIRPWQALAIGLAQVVALIPGISRSGATIVGGLLAGLDRRTATQFTFYLVIPTLGIATVYDLLKNLENLAPGDFGFLLVGAVVVAIVSLIAMRWLLNYVSKNSFRVFGYYRILAGIVILLLIAAGLPIQ